MTTPKKYEMETINNQSYNKLRNKIDSTATVVQSSSCTWFSLCSGRQSTAAVQISKPSKLFTYSINFLL